MRKQVLAYMKYSQHLEIVYVSTGNKMTKRQIRIHEVYEDTFRAYCYLRHAYRTFSYENVLAVFPIRHYVKKYHSMNNHEHNQDRGTKKWTTMMLPEHKEQLKGMWKQNNYRRKPIFDEQQLEVFHSTIMHAFTEEMIVRILHCPQERYMTEDVHEIKGKITDIHAATQQIKINDNWICLGDLLDIQLM